MQSMFLVAFNLQSASSFILTQFVRLIMYRIGQIVTII